MQIISPLQIYLSIIHFQYDSNIWDSETEKIFHQERSKKLPHEIQKRAFVILLMIDASTSEEDFRVPPSNRFEHLQGSLKEFFSIRINEKWRIKFIFKGGDTYEVSIVDYH